MHRFDVLLAPVVKFFVHTFNLTHPLHLNGKLSMEGLNGEVEIIRDRRGVPHIYAHSIEDAVFGQGYMHAQERLWQMDLYRRVVAGRVSEVMGSPGLETDIAMRTLGLRRWAEKSAEMIREDERPILEAYCCGVNACMVNEPLPLEFRLLGYPPEAWTVADSLSWNYLMFLYLGSSWESELLRGRLIQALGAEKAAKLELTAEEAWPLILDANLPQPLSPGSRFSWGSPADGVGSNNWVISGARSASGFPLLANDMHLQLSSPAIFFQNHLACDGLDVVGVSFPGVPLVIQGHNGRVAWGFTDGFADVQDLFEEHIREKGGVKEAEFKGEWQPLSVREEQICIKGKPIHKLVVEETRHGPLINAALMRQSEPGTPLAMSWTAFSARTFLLSILKMNQAKDCAQFKDALREWHAVNQNVVYADDQGNIAYHYIGDIPIRAKGNGSIPVPGWTGEYEWVGQIPFDELPRLLNPPAEFIVTANNRVAGSDFPYPLGNDYVSRDRAMRISELIEEMPVADTTRMQAMQFDQISPTARVFARISRELTPTSAREAAALELMRSWDGQLGPENPCAALYEVWVRQTLALMLDEKLEGLGESVRGGKGSGLWKFHAWEWIACRLDDPGSAWWQLQHYSGRDEVLLEALRRSLEFLSEQLGSEMSQWKWGSLHQLTFGHILASRRPLDAVFNLGPFPVGGDGSTVWASVSSFVDFHRSDVVGPPFRFIIDMADPAHARVTFVPGQSGRAGTQHYADGIEDWFHARYHPLLFLRDEVLQDTESCLILCPKKKR